MTNSNVLQKHKMAVLTFAGLLAPVYFIPKILSRVLSDQNLLSTLIAVALIVVLMSYVVMPFLTWLFRGWIEADLQVSENDRNDAIGQKTDVRCQEFTETADYQL